MWLDQGLLYIWTTYSELILEQEIQLLHKQVPSGTNKYATNVILIIKTKLNESCDFGAIHKRRLLEREGRVPLHPNKADERILKQVPCFEES